MMHHINLNSGWFVCETEQNEKWPAIVPGCIHSDLMRLGKIPDLNYRDNEYQAHWVAEKTWCYHTTFEVTNEMLKESHIILICEGLDTLAEIFVNGKSVAQTNNMFRQWEFSVRPYVHLGENHLEIRFSPLFEQMMDLQKIKVLPTWNIYDSRAAGRSWIRKMPCNFGWDWGLVAITCGIWKPIHIYAYSEPRLCDMRIEQQHHQNGVDLTIFWELSAPARQLAIALTSPDGKIEKIFVQQPEKNGSYTIHIEKPQLWWPNGMGKQPLYRLSLQLDEKHHNQLNAKELTIGLRTIELDRHKDEWGESFQFLVNGVPIYAKGANWIPANIFVSSITPDEYEKRILDAVQANMNMLRVWGGGIYEDDAFYELCDRYGILIWQDFIFACSSYPSFNQEFMENVKKEAVDNIRRLRHHPSLALWCGNNEIEQGIVDKEWNDLSMSWEDYAKLFEKLLPELVQTLAPDNNYWIASPHTPYGDRYDFNNPTCGDAHCWDVWFGGQNFEYQRTWLHRFMSEFGFQSFPELKTIESFTLPEDRDLNGYIMDYHQRSPNGNRKIFAYLLEWFRYPKNFTETLWLTQLTQAVAIQYACEHARRMQPRMMGTLYWQINDLWPCASWSSVDSFGRWKALQYFARRFYAPIMLSILEDTTTHHMTIHISNQQLHSLTAKCLWYACNLSGEILLSGEQEIHVQENAGISLSSIDCSQIIGEKISTATDLFNPPTSTERQFIFHALLVDAQGVIISDNIQFFTKPKYLDLQQSEIIQEIYEKDQLLHIRLYAQKPMLFVRLELSDTDAIFSDNFFYLDQHHSRDIVVLSSSKPLNQQQLENELHVSSLIDSYC